MWIKIYVSVFLNINFAIIGFFTDLVIIKKTKRLQITASFASQSIIQKSMIPEHINPLQVMVLQYDITLILMIYYDKILYYILQ